MSSERFSRFGYSCGAPAVILAFVGLLAAWGCTAKDGAGEEVLARVENRTVSVGDLEESTRHNVYSLGEAAEQWIDEQVLLQHAERSGFTGTNRLASIIQDYEQKLLSSLLLDSLSRRYIQISPDTIRAYYSSHLSDFQFQDSAALVLHVGFRRVEEARKALGLFHSSAGAQDSVLGLYNHDRQLVHRYHLIPALDEAVFGAPIGLFGGPFASDFGYHILMVEHFFSPGDTIPFLFVRKTIYERLFQEQLPLSRLTILDSLREDLNVEIYHE